MTLQHPAARSASTSHTTESPTMPSRRALPVDPPSGGLTPLSLEQVTLDPSGF